MKCLMFYFLKVKTFKISIIWVDASECVFCYESAAVHATAAAHSKMVTKATNYTKAIKATKATKADKATDANQAGVYRAFCHLIRGPFAGRQRD